MRLVAGKQTIAVPPEGSVFQRPVIQAQEPANRRIIAEHSTILNQLAATGTCCTRYFVIPSHNGGNFNKFPEEAGYFIRRKAGLDLVYGLALSRTN